jgi:CHASE2 domain-containing sensor protein
MSKLVTLKINRSSGGDGYAVTLRIEDQLITPQGVLLQPQIESDGKLPPAPEMLQDYSQWQQSYRHLDLRYRLEAIEGQVTQISRVDLITACEQTACRFQQSFDRWLNSDSFRRIRETLLGNVSHTEAARFILQTEDTTLQRLPWQLGDIFEKYPQAEVMLASPTYSKAPEVKTEHPRVRILAILGNSNGIDVDKDQQLLDQLPNATVKFLVEPTLDQLSDQLWQQHWDILFFAGHSSSQGENETGQIYINQTESFTLDRLKFSLRNAIANGLKIAIFNSCDGLGLARALSDLQIPQVIVMREPVPDRVAHAFLKSFLEQFSKGDSFYQSVREAREKLQPLEATYPCATWLPVIYQNLTTVAPTWKALAQERHYSKQYLGIAMLASLVMTAAIAAARFAGLLQPLELSTYDQMLRSRPPEPRDDRILVVTVTEEDVDRQSNSSGASISDPALNQLLEKILKHQPATLGIDIYLNHSISPNYKTLHRALQSGKLITVCKVADPAINRPERKPPKGSTRYGFSDALEEAGAMTRRHLLAMDPQPGECRIQESLASLLAADYLTAQKIELDPNRPEQLGKATLPFLVKHTGGYQQFDDAGYQLLLNYRSNGSIQEVFQSISLNRMLNLPEQQLKPLIKNRLVLIGTTDPSFHDVATTPYYFTQSNNRCPAQQSQSQCAPGVFIQAQKTSQLISAALGERPLLWAFPFWADGLFVLLSSGIGAILVWRVRNSWILISLAGGAIALLWVSSIILLTTPGLWLPVIPMLVGFILTGSYVRIYLIRNSTLRSNPLLFVGRKT